jgi:hypothetical protein
MFVEPEQPIDAMAEAVEVAVVDQMEFFAHRYGWEAARSLAELSLVSWDAPPYRCNNIGLLRAVTRDYELNHEEYARSLEGGEQ